MGQKQQLTDQNGGPKKKRTRVCFANTCNEVEVNQCIEIYMVSSKEEVNSSNGFKIFPVDLSEFFGGSKIYGYQGLKITIWISSLTFHAYADVKFESSSDGGKGITDLKDGLQKIFSDNLVESKEEFFQKFSIEDSYIKSLLEDENVSQGEISIQHIKSFDSNTDKSSIVEVIRMSVGSAAVNSLYNRLVPLVFILIDGSNPIEIDDPGWELYISIQKKIDDKGCQQYLLLGFAAAYRFFRYPDTSRLRVGQMLIFPPHQHKGHGCRLLEVINGIAISENLYDLTMEEPLGNLQHIRTCIDTIRLRPLEAVQHAVNSAVLQLKDVNPPTTRLLPPLDVVDEVRRKLKINRKQFLHCWEVLIFLGLQPADDYMERYVAFVSGLVNAAVLGRDGRMEEKRVLDVPCDFDEEISFVMFRSPGLEGGVVRADEGCGDQEEQLLRMVVERVDEMKAIAEKVLFYASE